MYMSTLAVSIVLITLSSNLAVAVKKEIPSPQMLSRGWGDELSWVPSYEEGLYNAKKSKKPLMVIHHSEDCQQCQALKKAFSKSAEVQELAKKNFIMLNLMHETTDKNLAPDGQYVPRILFIGERSPGLHIIILPSLDVFRITGVADPSFKVRADITGRYSNRLYAYGSQDMPLLIENMKKVRHLSQTEL